MTPMTKTTDLQPFDFAEHLDSEEAIEAYLADIMKEGDDSLLASALGDIAKARGMADIAQKSGITREALYKALRPGAKPRYDTIRRVMGAMGYTITLQRATA